MSKTTKIILGVLAGLLVLCLCIGVVFVAGSGLLVRKITRTAGDPTQAAKIAQSIAEYDLPAGAEQFAMNILGFEYVMIYDEDQADELIILMQFPDSANLSQEQMEEQMSQAWSNQIGGSGYSFKKVASEKVIIRKNWVNMTVQEGSRNDRATMRQMIGVFEGNNGLVMILISGEKDNWDQKRVDAFLKSIR